MFSGLPSDSFFKTLFFGALILIAFLIKHNSDNSDKLDNEINKFKGEGVEIKYKLNVDTLKYINLAKKIEDLSMTFKKGDPIGDKEIENNKTQLAQYSLDMKRLRDEKWSRYNELNPLLKKLENAESNSFYLYIILSGILLVGFIPWAVKEVTKDNFEKNKMLKEEKKIPCQSCGMILKNDFKPFMEVELCSNCYDGQKYKEPDLTFKEMNDRVQSRMKAQGIDETTTKKHLTKLANLNRWNKTLKW